MDQWSIHINPAWQRKSYLELGRSGCGEKADILFSSKISWFFGLLPAAGLSYPESMFILIQLFQRMLMKCSLTRTMTVMHMVLWYSYLSFGGKLWNFLDVIGQILGFIAKTCYCIICTLHYQYMWLGSEKEDIIRNCFFSHHTSKGNQYIFLRDISCQVLLIKLNITGYYTIKTKPFFYVQIDSPIILSCTESSSSKLDVKMSQKAI